jgi:hypothetical protein
MACNGGDRFPYGAIPFSLPEYRVQCAGWSADEIADEPNSFEAITCTACGSLHLVNRSTGRVLGFSDQEDK